jgi:DNA-directed RNA polymerase specialized sigma24 family protein
LVRILRSCRPWPTAQRQEESRERSRRLKRAPDALSPQQREVILLHLHGELTFRAIEGVPDRPLGTVVSWYRRGLRRLRQHLEEDHERNRKTTATPTIESTLDEP